MNVVMRSDNFVDWLGREIEERGWTYQELADRGGFTRSAVSTVMTRRQNPGLEFCKGVARAFFIRPETVLRMAGLLPPEMGETDDPSLQQWWEFGKGLTPEQREDAVRYAMWRQMEGEPPRQESDSPNDVGPAPTSLGKAKS